MNIKAIETKYKGYRFRSRLEARWAVFFDSLNIKWEYEKEGYHFDDGTNYLCDFWLSTVKMWAEVKGEEFTIEEIQKAQNLANESGFPVLMLVGVPERKPYCAIYKGCKDRDWTWNEYILSNFHDYPQNEGRFYCMPGYDEEINESWFDDVGVAVEKARSARFEFGGS